MKPLSCRTWSGLVDFSSCSMGSEVGAPRLCSTGLARLWHTVVAPQYVNPLESGIKTQVSCAGGWILPLSHQGSPVMYSSHTQLRIYIFRYIGIKWFIMLSYQKSFSNVLSPYCPQQRNPVYLYPALAFFLLLHTLSVLLEELTSKPVTHITHPATIIISGMGTLWREKFSSRLLGSSGWPSVKLM